MESMPRTLTKETRHALCARCIWQKNQICLRTEPGRVRFPGAIGTPALLPSRKTPTTASTTDSVLIFLKTDEDIDETGTLQFSSKLAQRILRTGHGVPRSESTVVPFGVAETSQPLATRPDPGPPHGIAKASRAVPSCTRMQDICPPPPTDHGIAGASQQCNSPNNSLRSSGMVSSKRPDSRHPSPIFIPNNLRTRHMVSQSVPSGTTCIPVQNASYPPTMVSPERPICAVVPTQPDGIAVASPPWQPKSAWHDCFTQPTQVTSERPRP